MEDDGASDVLGELALDVPDHLPALFDVGFDRLCFEVLLQVLVAVVGVIPQRPAGIVFVEILVRIVQRAARLVDADAVVLFEDAVVIQGRIDDLQVRVDIDVFQLIVHDQRGIAEGWNVSREDPGLQALVRPIAQFTHDRPGFLPPFGQVRIVAQQCVLYGQGHAPDAVRGGQHGATERALALVLDIVEGFAVDRERQRTPDVGVIEWRDVAVDDQVGTDIGAPHLALQLRRLALQVAQQRHGHVGRVAHVELAGDQAQHPRAPIWHDAVLDRIQIGQPLLPVVGVALHLHALVQPVFDELEGAGADGLGAHLGRRYVARIDRRPASREQRQEGRLRAAEDEGHFVRAVDRNLLQVVVPRLTRALADFSGHQTRHHIPGAFHIRRGERLAVVERHALSQGECQLRAVIAPFPGCGEFRLDRVHLVLRRMLVEQDQVVIERHERDHDRRGGLLVNRGAGRRVDMRQCERAAIFLRYGRRREPTQGGQDQGGHV